MTTTDTTPPTPLTDPAAPQPPHAEPAHLRPISCAQIACAHNPRTLFPADGEGGLRELAASIAASGLLQPIVVRPNSGPDAVPPTYRHPYRLVAGERRLRAVRDILGQPTILAIVREDLDDHRARAATVLENLQRRDLHPMEEARGLADLRTTGGHSTKYLARVLGRSEDWVKERLKLCDLPTAAQDAYLADKDGRITLRALLELHQYTKGGRDDRGFPTLIEVAVAELTKTNTGGIGLSILASRNPTLIRHIQHWNHDAGGRWGQHYFDTKATCTRCPFGAYRKGYYDGEGYCLLPAHYAELRDRGKGAYDKDCADREAQRRADPAYAKAETDRAIATQATTQSTGQKAAKTRKRHQQQKADYWPHVRAIEQATAMIANVDGSTDLAVLAAYLLGSSHVSHEAVEQVTKRHNLPKGTLPIAMWAPRAKDIETLRPLPPADLLRYTIEALLLTQAQRARDWDPQGKHQPEAVLRLYLGDQLQASARDVTDR